MLPSPPLKLSQQIGRVRHSATIANAQRVKALRDRGVQVVNLGVGEPDWETPAHIRRAAQAALDAGATRYTDPFGTLELRQALSGWLERAHGLAFGNDELIVSAGAKQILYSLFQSILDEGDEVVIPSPCWTSYPDLVRAARATPVLVPSSADSGFQLEPEAMARAVTARTQAVLLPSPCNPTGTVFRKERVRPIVELCAARKILVIADDIYRSLSYVEQPTIARQAAEAGAPLFIVDGVSKIYCMTGFRIGFGAGHRALIKAMGVIQSQTISCNTSISQVAATAALEGPQDFVDQMREEYRRRRDQTVTRIRELPRVQLPVEPEGAFYAFCDFTAWLGARTPEGQTIEDDVALAGYLLDQGHVAVLPGSAFEGPGFLRISYATSLDQINLGFDGIKKALSQLTPR
jgi:aspartate aminotransferase